MALFSAPFLLQWCHPRSTVQARHGIDRSIHGLWASDD